MTTTQSRWDKIEYKWRQEGPVGIALWATNWTLWKTRAYYAMPGPMAENVQARFRYAERTKKFGIHEPIIVYQMGKVGSTTMVRSLQDLRLNVPVYHLHNLNHPDQIEAWAKQTLRDPSKVMRMVKVSRRVVETLNRPVAPRYNLVCMVRTPVPRNLSMFFQNIGSYIPDWEARYRAHALPYEELTEFFLHRFLDETPGYWFDQEVRQVFDLDVFATPFDRVRGYQIYENARARLIVIRLEDLNRVAAHAMREFLNIPDMRLVDSNIGESNAHGELYKDYLKQLRLPHNYIEKTNATQFARHFYTPEELQASVARWVAPK